MSSGVFDANTTANGEDTIVHDFMSQSFVIMPHSILTLSYLSSGSNSTALPDSVVAVVGLTIGIGITVMMTTVVAFIVYRCRPRGWCIYMHVLYM